MSQLLPNIALNTLFQQFFATNPSSNSSTETDDQCTLSQIPSESITQFKYVKQNHCYNSQPNEKGISKRYTQLRKQLRACNHFQDNYFVFETSSKKDKKRKNISKKTVTSPSNSAILSCVEPTSQQLNMAIVDSYSAFLSEYDQQLQQLFHTWQQQQQMATQQPTEQDEATISSPNGNETLEDLNAPPTHEGTSLFGSAYDLDKMLAEDFNTDL